MKLLRCKQYAICSQSTILVKEILSKACIDHFLFKVTCISDPISVVVNFFLKHAIHRHLHRNNYVLYVILIGREKQIA